MIFIVPSARTEWHFTEKKNQLFPFSFLLLFIMRSRRQIVLPVFLGQLLSLCIVGTSTASSALWNHYGISIPCTQNFCNYLLLAIIYGRSAHTSFKFSRHCKVHIYIYTYSINTHAYSSRRVFFC